MTKRICNSALILAVLSMASSLSAQTNATQPTQLSVAAPATASMQAADAKPAQPSAEDTQKMMSQMMDLAKLGDNHKLLGELAGTWNFVVKSWMSGDTSAKPEESKGTAVRKPIMDGRFYVLDVSGKMEMPGPDGKKKEMAFKGMGVEGYDNVKKKFYSSWVDNMGTGMMMSEGDYDPSTKTFTYNGEFEAIPGMKQKVREVIKINDKDHHLLEWYEDRNGTDTKTMEISYSRAKK
jgi:hypothetical protein